MKQAIRRPDTVAATDGNTIELSPEAVVTRVALGSHPDRGLGMAQPLVEFLMGLGWRCAECDQPGDDSLMAAFATGDLRRAAGGQ